MVQIHYWSLYIGDVDSGNHTGSLVPTTSSRVNRAVMAPGLVLNYRQTFGTT